MKVRPCFRQANDVLSVRHKVYVLKSCSLWLFFGAQGAFHSLIRGLFELINKESSLDQSTAGQSYNSRRGKTSEQRLQNGPCLRQDHEVFSILLYKPDF